MGAREQSGSHCRIKFRRRIARFQGTSDITFSEVGVEVGIIGVRRIPRAARTLTPAILATKSKLASRRGSALRANRGTPVTGDAGEL